MRQFATCASSPCNGDAPTHILLPLPNPAGLCARALRQAHMANQLWRTGIWRTILERCILCFDFSWIATLFSSPEWSFILPSNPAITCTSPHHSVFSWGKVLIWNKTSILHETFCQIQVIPLCLSIFIIFLLLSLFFKSSWDISIMGQIIGSFIFSDDVASHMSVTAKRHKSFI